MNILSDQRLQNLKPNAVLKRSGTVQLREKDANYPERTCVSRISLLYSTEVP